MNKLEEIKYKNILFNIDDKEIHSFIKRLTNESYWADINNTIELNDCAMKEYSELIEVYTMPRWMHFLDSLNSFLIN